MSEKSVRDFREHMDKTKNRRWGVIEYKKKNKKCENIYCAKYLHEYRREDERKAKAFFFQFFVCTK